jgi:outer membrane protein assembly factor BamB
MNADKTISDPCSSVLTRGRFTACNHFTKLLSWNGLAFAHERTAMRYLLFCVAAGLMTIPGLLWADDYPQWRGPLRDGVSKETGLLKEWPKGGPKLRWQANDLGWGYSTPSVAKGRIYLIGSPEEKPGKTEHVIALNEADGTKIWSTKIGGVGPNTKQQYPGPRSTPTVDGNRIYALGSDGDLVCLDTAQGDIVWHKSFRGDFDGQMGYWAYSESPLIDGDLVVCSPGGKKATMVALNKADGKVVWECALPEGDMAGYSSVIVCEVGGIRQYVQFLHKGVVGIEAKTGKFLWRYTNTSDNQFNMNVPTPIFHDNCILTATQVKGAGLIKLAADGEKMSVSEVYLNKKLQNNHGGLVLVDGHVYGTSSSMLLCMDFQTGKELWSNRCVGKGSLCYADGCLYVRGEKGGEVALVEANPMSYQEKGRFTPPGSTPSNVWPHPVAANGYLYLRDQNKLFCYDIKAPSK